jgi:hypothetical protein
MRSNAGIQNLNVGAFKSRKVANIHSSKLSSLVAIVKVTVVLYSFQILAHVPR